MSDIDSAASAKLTPEVVRIADVNKTFTVRRDQSLKDRVVEFGKHKQHRKTYQALQDVSLSINAGSTVGFLGANGSGKSTLLKLIAGILAPDTGTVAHRGRIAALLELGAGFHPDLSGRENIYLNAAILGLSRAETDARMTDILQFSGISEFIDTQVKFYSSGMYMRLAFSVAIHTDPDILLVDEVLAVGDEAFQRKCMDRIRQFQQEGRTIILVSHAASQVAELCDRAVVLSDGQIVHDGTVSKGLSVLRDILEDRRLDEAAVAVDSSQEEKPAPPTDPLKVVEIETLNERGARTAVFEQGAPLTIRIHVEALEPASEWTTGFSVDTPNGQMVLASNTKMQGTKLPAIPVGVSSMDYHIDAIRLGAGEYFVNANTSRKINVNTHVLWQGARFQVTGPEDNLGVVEAKITVT